MLVAPLTARSPRPARWFAALLAIGLISGVGRRALSAHGVTPDRPFAPGVVTTIPPDFSADETVSTHDIVEIRKNPNIRWKPELLSESRTLYGMSSDVKFRRDVWCLEFSFKPLRMISVNVGQPNGSSQTKSIWYLVYAVKNTGKMMVPVAGQDGVYSVTMGKGGPVQFVPSFVLQAQDRDATGGRVNKAYLDRIVPAAYDAIRAREVHDQPLLNSAQMAMQPIPVSDARADRSVWGYVAWEDVDPRIDFLSIYVGGLTNAYQWVDPPGAYKPGDMPAEGRQFVRKTLQLNFWRPGDEFSKDETAVRYGVAPGRADLYDVPPGTPYRWVYIAAKN
jgi:hypothetical protein